MNVTHLKPVSEASGKILAVDDDKTTLMILSSLLENLSYDTMQAGNGEEALEIVAQHADSIDVIVLDKTMPEMDGLEVIEALKENPGARHIPVVMVTGSNQPEEIKEGIDAGVFYYLTKPYEEDVFRSIVSSAMHEANRYSTLKADFQKHQTSFGFIDRAEFTIRTLEEAENLSCFIANCFPNPTAALPGLSSLLINAVEHGNLEIGYHEKTRLIEQGTWSEEIIKRQEKPEFHDRIVKVLLEHDDHETSVTIMDEGHGFNWSEYMDIDPARAKHNHGRGIAMSNIVSFDEVHYNQKGNTVKATSHAISGLKW